MSTLKGMFSFGDLGMPPFQTASNAMKRKLAGGPGSGASSER